MSSCIKKNITNMKIYKSLISKTKSIFYLQSTISWKTVICA
nr:MAG TPA: hypothetical protein [Caudoviricetes sp.]DAW83869.1 MAG TPA: hypothetical protein [Bacteriophage sp.]DAZ73973.1 MAG TPA: hypothetical protein [Caudoviricetes sp.]